MISRIEANDTSANEPSHLKYNFVRHSINPLHFALKVVDLSLDNFHILQYPMHFIVLFLHIRHNAQYSLRVKRSAKQRHIIKQYLEIGGRKSHLPS